MYADHSAAVYCSFKPSGNARAVPIFLACNISSVAGSYSIVFAVTNSAGMSSNVTRQLIIKPNCPDGESLCPHKVRCKNYLPHSAAKAPPCCAA